MLLKGKKTRVVRWIHSRMCVVRLEVDAIIPDSDPREPCLEPKVIRWLDDVQQKADAGMIEELSKIGEVYVRRSA